MVENNARVSTLSYELEAPLKENCAPSASYQKRLTNHLSVVKDMYNCMFIKTLSETNLPIDMARKN